MGDDPNTNDAKISSEHSKELSDQQLDAVTGGDKATSTPTPKPTKVFEIKDFSFGVENP